MNTILDAMFRFLRPDAAPHHVRAVELLWKINQRAPLHTLESVISHRMAAQGQARIDALHAFGVLWRLTGKSISSIVADGETTRCFLETFSTFRSVGSSMHWQAQILSSKLPQKRGCAVISSLTSGMLPWSSMADLISVLDPLLARLLAANHHGKDGVNKAMPDVAMFNHLVVNITALFRFGAGSLSRICRDAVVQRSNHAVLRDRASTCE